MTTTTTTKTTQHIHHHHQHDAWHVLFFNSFFWERTGKHGLQLRKVCKSFRDQIPEQYAIETAFIGVSIRKVDIFRLFPLAVYDVVRMRSPLLFVDAFKLALVKTGGFDFCIAVMRDKGNVLWNSKGIKREMLRSRLNTDLVSGGIVCGGSGPLFEAVVSGSKSVDSAAVWYHDSSSSSSGGSSSFIFHNNNKAAASSRASSSSSYAGISINSREYESILFCLRDAVGFWYKGINKDVHEIVGKIRSARASFVVGGGGECRSSSSSSSSSTTTIQHHHVAGKKFIIGVIRLRPEYYYYY